MKSILAVLVVTFIFGPHYSTQHVPNDSCGGCLLLSPYIKQGQIARAQTLSQIDPASLLGLKSHSGFITVNKKYNSNQFFWFFPAEELDVTPLIIWVGGGPGFTALKGLFEIIGPLRIEDGQVKLRDISWANYSLLFLDVPLGAGFSFTDSEEGYNDNEDDIGTEMLVFLQQFLQLFPKLRKAPLFITGQSYAGKYVPALAIKIHRQMSNNSINLRGIAMGNALIDPRNMMEYSQLCAVLGILDDGEIKVLRRMEKAAVRYTDAGRMADAGNKFNETIEYIKKRSGVSITNFLQHQPLVNQAPAFESYVNKPETRELIRVGSVTFHFNNQKVYRKMITDIMNSTRPFVEELLEHYGVMCYSGQLDILIGYSLSRNMFKKLQWSQRSEYVKAIKERILDNDGKIVAYCKSGGNFVDMLIRDAGHNAPADQPEAAKLVIDEFIDAFK